MLIWSNKMGICIIRWKAKTVIKNKTKKAKIIYKKLLLFKNSKGKKKKEKRLK